MFSTKNTGTHWGELGWVGGGEGWMQCWVRFAHLLHDMSHENRVSKQVNHVLCFYFYFVQAVSV